MTNLLFQSLKISFFIIFLFFHAEIVMAKTEYTLDSQQLKEMIKELSAREAIHKETNSEKTHKGNINTDLRWHSVRPNDSPYNLFYFFVKVRKYSPPADVEVPKPASSHFATYTVWVRGDPKSNHKNISIEFYEKGNEILFFKFLAFFHDKPAPAKTEYRLEPEKFEELIEDWSTEQAADRATNSQRMHNLSTSLPGLGGINMDLPEKLIIRTDNIRAFNLEQVQLPITYKGMLQNRQWAKFYSQHVVYMKNIKSGETLAVHIDLRWHDAIPYDSTPPGTSYEAAYISNESTYNLFHFFHRFGKYFPPANVKVPKLPPYSATYDVWVQIGDVQSIHKKVAIEFYENGKLVERAKEGE